MSQKKTLRLIRICPFCEKDNIAWDCFIRLKANMCPEQVVATQTGEIIELPEAPIRFPSPQPEVESKSIPPEMNHIEPPPEYKFEGEPPERELNKEKPPEFNTEMLFSKIAEAKSWKSTTPARSFIVNKCGIKEERIDKEPEAVWNEIKDIL